MLIVHRSINVLYSIQWELLASSETHQWIQTQYNYYRQSIGSCTLSFYIVLQIFTVILYYLKTWFFLLCLLTLSSQILIITLSFFLSSEPWSVSLNKNTVKLKETCWWSDTITDAYKKIQMFQTSSINCYWLH